MRSNLLRIKSERPKHGRKLILLLATWPIIGIVALSFIWVGKTAASGTTIIVNTNDDTDDGACDAAHCSLREAIDTANALPGYDTIDFIIPATSTIQLSPNAQLPVIIDPLSINGSGQTVTFPEDASMADRVFEIGAGTAVTLTRLTISEGHALIGGAGIHNEGDLTLIESTLSKNSALVSGNGAIYNGGGTLHIIRSTITGNFADPNVAGIINFSGTAIIDNSTINHNVSALGYAGIYNVETSGTVIINHSTFDENETLGTRTDIVNRGTLYLRNSILAGGCLNLGVVAESIQTFVSDGTCGAVYSGDPRLGPLMDYGGPTLTQALLEGSLAIDNADPAYCPPTDQRGVSRPDGAACDLGAFEGFFSPTAVSLTDINQQPNQATWLWLLILVPILFGAVRKMPSKD